MANYRQALIDKIDCNIEQSEVVAGKIRTAYLSAGQGFPVIVLHGAGAGAVTWYPSIAAISKNFRVIAPDIVGYGESDKPNAAYDRAYFASWLKDYFLAMDISKAHIVGLSQGGAIALQFAIENPGLVEKLVLVNSAALGAQPAFKPFLAMVWMNLFPSLLSHRFASRYLLAKTECRDPNHIDYSVEVLKKSGGKNAFTQGRGAAVSAIPEESLRQIQNHTLIIWGEGDNFFSIGHGESAAQIIPNAKLKRIKGAGHLSLMDQPEVFNNALIEFLIE
mgnify:CR=1 FL=1